MGQGHAGSGLSLVELRQQPVISGGEIGQSEWPGTPDRPTHRQLRGNLRPGNEILGIHPVVYVSAQQRQLFP